MDMTEDVFADLTFGKIALQKFASPEPNFRLYIAGWVGRANQCEVMQVTGAVFRKAMRGPNKGLLTIMIPKTTRTVLITAEEMARFEAGKKTAKEEVHV
jgi:hypothetical protein